jgi:hypothetical protein
MRHRGVAAEAEDATAAASVTEPVRAP